MFFSKSFDELADVFLPLFRLHMATYLPMQNDNLVSTFCLRSAWPKQRNTWRNITISLMTAISRKQQMGKPGIPK